MSGQQQQANEVRHLTVLDDETRRVARIYAEALYKAAEEQNQAEAVLSELESLVNEVFKKDPGAELFFASAAVNQDRKQAAIESAFGSGRSSSTFTNFLGVLNRHDRLGMLRGIAQAYRALHDRKTKQITVHVRSAVPLTDAERDRVRNDVRTVAGFEPNLEETVDPDILGGIIIRIRDWVYDASVRTRIHTIRNQLVERSSHGIQSGRDRFSSDA